MVEEEEEERQTDDRPRRQRRCDHDDEGNADVENWFFGKRRWCLLLEYSRMLPRITKRGLDWMPCYILKKLLYTLLVATR